jgi:hypothetical protein
MRQIDHSIVGQQISVGGLLIDDPEDDIDESFLSRYRAVTGDQHTIGLAAQDYVIARSGGSTCPASLDLRAGEHDCCAGSR